MNRHANHAITAPDTSNTEARQYAENIIDSMREALVVLDNAMHVVSANRSFYKKFQVVPEDTEGRLIYDLGNGQWDIQDLRHLLEEIIPEKKTIEDFEVQHRFENIGQKVMMLNARQMVQGPGKSPLILLAIEDVTDQYENRVRLEEAELKYHKFVEEINSIIIGFDRQGNITFFNHFSEKLFGYNRNEVIGRPFIGTIIPTVDSEGNDNRPIAEEIFIEPSRYYANENEGVCREGSRIWFSWSAKGVRNEVGEVIEILIDGNDITGIIALRRELVEKSATLDTLLDFIPEGIMITDANHEIKKVSRYISEIFGMPAEKLLSANEPDRLKMLDLHYPAGKRVQPDDLPLSQAIITGQRFDNVELVYTHDEIQKILSINAAPVRDAKGRVTGAVGGWRDVTEQRKLLTKCEESVARFHATMKALPNGFIVYTTKGGIQIINDTAKAILGYDDSIIHRPLVQRMRILNILESDGSPLQKKNNPVIRALKGEVVRNQVLKFGAAKKVRWLSLSAAPVMTDENTIAGAVMNFSDISEIIALQETLSRSEQQFHSMFKEHRAVMLIIDPETGAIEDANRAAQLYYGYSPEQLRGMSIKQINQLLPDQVHKEIQATIEQQRDHHIFPHRLADKSIRWVEVYSSPINVGEKHLLFSIIHDVTERKRAEDELQRRTAQLEATVNSLPDGYIVYNRDGTIMRMNTVAEDVLGYTENEYELSYEQRMTNLRIETPSGDPFPFQQIPSHRALTYGETTRDVIMRIRRKSRDYWISVSAAPVTDPEGTVYGAVMEFADVTDIHELQQRCAAERNFMETILQTTGALITVLDREAKIIQFNRACEESTGYTGAEVQGRSVLDLFIADEEREEVELVANRLLSDESMIEHDNHWLTKSGQKRFVRWRNSVVRAKSGDVEYVIASGIDITDRKLAEEEIRRNKVLLEVILNAIPDGIVFSDSEGKINFFNPAAKRILGSPVTGAAEGPEPGSYELLKPDGEPLQPEEMPLIRTVRTDERVSDMEIIIRRKDGREVFVLAGSVPVHDESGRVTGAVASLRDITERKRVEDELQKNRKDLNRAQEVAHIGSWRLDTRHNELVWSNEVYHMFGIPKGTPLTYEIFLSFIHPDDREFVDEKWNAAMKGESYDIQHRIVAEKTVKWVRELAELEFDESGELLGGFGTVQDITGRKSLEDELHQRAEELAATNRELESFSYSVSHDLRNPLQTINAFTALVKELYGEQLTEEGVSFLNQIEVAVQKMSSLINDLLNLSRIGRQEIIREEVDLSAIVREYLEKLHRDQSGKNVEFNIEEDVHALADQRLITLALENLLRNAWKFTSKKEKARIEFGTTPYNNGYAFYIRDNGAGFDMKIAKTIFEPFKRGHAEKEYRGTGVGLSIVYRVVSRHGGKVWAEGAVGKGACFYFTFG
ncbi:MAG: PAS domain S-box protein [Chitinivibrionales bacterium]|nr:PAS domain S-box protein [Chitinivibrionales bacterium]